jgi:hypothetical protein
MNFKSLKDERKQIFGVLILTGLLIALIGANFLWLFTGRD